jgi:hypothetical protein
VAYSPRALHAVDLEGGLSTARDRLPQNREVPMATAKRKAAPAQFAAKAKSGRGKVGKAAKSTAAPRRKRKAKGS